MLGHEKIGAGPVAAIVLNDWLGDTSIWDAARPYLDEERFTWVLADLRGYGRSRGRVGAYTVIEAAEDVLQLAQGLNRPRVAIVGHSMSSLVALHLAQQHGDQIDRVVALTPPPPTGLGVDPSTVESLRRLGHADDEMRAQALAAMQGQRLGARWIPFLVDRWRHSDADAVAGYVPVFTTDGLPHPSHPISMEVLMVTGEQDAEPMRRAATERAYATLCPRLIVTPLADSGHYPMSETPPLLVATIERWLAAIPTDPSEQRLR